MWEDTRVVIRSESCRQRWEAFWAEGRAHAEAEALEGQQEAGVAEAE